MGWIGPLWVGLAAGVAARWLHPAGKCLGWAAALVTGGLGALLGYYSGQSAHLYADDQIMAWTTAVVGATLLPMAWDPTRR